MRSGPTGESILAMNLDTPNTTSGRRHAATRCATFLAILGALAAPALSATPALAAQRFAAPTPAGAADCSSPANACSLEEAMGKAAKADEVLVEPGDYGTPESPLTKTLEGGAEELDIHGVDTTPGPPGARIFTAAPTGMDIFRTDTTVSDLEIVDSDSSLSAALMLDGAGVLGQRLIVRAGPHEQRACLLNLTAELHDSVCQQQGEGEAIEVSGVLNGPNTVTLRNDTAIAGGIGILAESAGLGRTTAVSVINTIARGGEPSGGSFDADITAVKSENSASIVTSHSNYATKHTTGGGTITQEGTNQTVGDQSAAQLFVEPLLGNFVEALGAQTIAAGLDAEGNGPRDVQGNPRETGSHTDIGAYQCVLPGALTESAGAVAQTTATLAGTLTPNALPGSYEFLYGTTTSYGSATPVSSAGSGRSPTPVSAALTGLAPDTTYHYELTASDCSGTSSGGDQTFTTAPATSSSPVTPPGPPPPAPLPRPTVSHVSQSHPSWREGGALARTSARRRARASRRHHRRRPPVGTTFAFTLNESARVTFSFTHGSPGRRVELHGHKRCLAQTRKDRRARHCTRTVVAGTLVFTGHAGVNRVFFDGRLSRHHRLSPGRYELTITAVDASGSSSPRSLGFTIAR